MMRTETQTVSIETAGARVFDFVSNPENLPRWAKGFCTSLRREEGRWIVSSPRGEIALRMTTDAKLGVVDFHLSPAPGIESVAASRVVQRGQGCAYIFTFHQTPGMPDEDFESQRRTLAGELRILKDLMEGREISHEPAACLPAAPAPSRPRGL